jgi:hypothetical protein
MGKEIVHLDWITAGWTVPGQIAVGRQLTVRRLGMATKSM